MMLCAGCIDQDAKDDHHGSTISELLEEGHEHFLSGRYNESLDCYTDILEIDPENGTVWIRKGDILEFTGNHDDAVECYNKAVECHDNKLEDDPENATLWFSKGIVLSLYFNKENEAIECYDKAVACVGKELKENPDNVTAWMFKGTLLEAAGRYDEALECYDKLLAMDSDNKTVSMAYLAKGFLLSNDFGLHEQAIECYDKALDAYPDGDESWIIWINKGYALMELYKYEEAIAVFNNGLKTYPDNMGLRSTKNGAETKLEEGKTTPVPSDTLSDYMSCFNGRKGEYLCSLLSAELKERTSLDEVEDIMDEYRSNNIRMGGFSHSSGDTSVSGNTAVMKIEIDWNVQGDTITVPHNVSFVFEDRSWKIDGNLITMENVSQE
ncbi:MAG: tetratricopeptide repeat protein [Methanosarcinaceae archaeon]|nr:tetratricopeptide repeat protein [Methanosarcinaceae archaeon]